MAEELQWPIPSCSRLALMATAATADDLKGLYAGIGVGSTSVDGRQVDDSDTSFKIFAGYSFNKFLALELSYLDGGTAKEAQNFLIPGTPPASISDEVENKIFNLSVVGTLPLTEAFSLFGKLGYAHELPSTAPLLSTSSSLAMPTPRSSSSYRGSVLGFPTGSASELRLALLRAFREMR